MFSLGISFSVQKKMAFIFKLNSLKHLFKVCYVAGSKRDARDLKKEEKRKKRRNSPCSHEICDNVVTLFVTLTVS